MMPIVDEDDIPLTWDPVPVPRPTYTMKAKAQRPEVAPAAVTPDPASDLRRRWSDAAVGAWAETPTVRARVTSVAVVRSADPGYGDPLTSRGSLVVTAVDASVRRQVVLFSHVLR